MSTPARRHRLAALLALALLALPVGASAASDAPQAQAAATAGLTEVGRFDTPVYVGAPPADPTRLFVVERAGRVRLVRDGRTLATPFADLTSRVLSGGERGLLSIAFAPDYATSRKLYLSYTDRRGDLRVDELRRFATDADRADPGTRRTILRVPHRRYPNHNGGQLQFGPGGLYVSTGDGGGAGDPLRTAQRLNSMLGKILRIDPRRRSGGRAYAIPRGNPFRNLRGARDEVFSYGLRNPWRFSFDRANGNLAIADVGQDAVEEINFVPRSRGGGRGANFGWSRFEGTRRYLPGSVRRHVRPVLQRSHSAGYCAIVGGYVIRDPRLPALAGRYVYGDFCRAGLRSVRLSAGRASDDRSLGARVPALSSFGEDALGRVYAVSLSGPVYRLGPG